VATNTEKGLPAQWTFIFKNLFVPQLQL